MLDENGGNQSFEISYCIYDEFLKNDLYGFCFINSFIKHSFVFELISGFICFQMC